MEKASSSISHNTLLSNLLDFSLLYSIVYDFQQSISCFFHHKSSSFCDFEPKLDDKNKSYDVGKKDLEHLVSKNGKNEGDYYLFGHDINLVMERHGYRPAPAAAGCDESCDLLYGSRLYGRRRHWRRP